MRTLLFDADALAYRDAVAHQRTYDWGDGVTSIATDLGLAKKTIVQQIDATMEKLEADNFIICLSDDIHSFRKEMVDPTYKKARQDVERPVHLYTLKEWLAETYPTDRRPRLEADDVMGILATDPSATDERIIVSADKDMMTVPAKLYRPQNDKGQKRPPIMDISLEEANRFHLWQTIVGDTTDGYAGLPGAGPVEAEKLLEGWGWSSYVHVFKSGPRKGLEEVRWERSYMDVWNAIVSGYIKAGLKEADAITQARLARILRYGEWDGRSPRLWNPPTP